ncbi:phytoene desaturase family protein [Ketobacter alkanivorans]|uniref:Amine oxidase domain-containing protein n=1 Tax=Ketobacter alkanivorans TaxID=1917421 RepID=A0A2K9LS41_9GAMM|nr:NAD(P)/FAD-dependent oxidoreductase [Ketobacter alkanivorans]AUM14275.1 hypothetical protein Kalk_18410 [Ketobacter alkanivorans]
MENQHYDAIVIGSGLGGLTAGALWAQQGKRVLVIERHDKLGGAATVYQRKHLDIEVGLHELCGFGHLDLMPQIWNQLKLDDRIQRLPVPSFFGVRKSGQAQQKVMPEGWNEAKAAALRHFPHQKHGILRYFQIMQAIRSNIFHFVNAKKTKWWWLRNAPLMPLRFRAMFKYNKMTVSQLFQDLFGDDEEIKFFLAANIGYYSDRPQELSAVFYAIAQGSYHEGGGYYIKGGSQKLSDALMDIIREAGGEALIRRTVTDILLDDQGRACGVTHEKNLTIGKRRDPKDKLPRTAHAPLIFGNAAPNILQNMLPADKQQAFMAPYTGLPLSPALWVLFVGMDHDPKAFGVSEYATFVVPEHCNNFDDYASFKTAFANAPGDTMPGYVFTDYSKLNTGLNEKSRHFAVLCGIDDMNNWEDLSEQDYYARKEAWETALLKDLDKQFPGIGQHIVFHEMGTARTMNEYLNTPMGATYGFSQNAPFIKSKPPTTRTAVPGLFLASAFGSHGGGFVGAILSGANAAKQAGRWAEQHQAAPHIMMEGEPQPTS